MCALKKKVSYLIGEGLVDLFLKLLHGLRVGGQVVEEEGQRAAARLIPSEDEHHGLRQDLMVTQTCRGKNAKL